MNDDIHKLLAHASKVGSPLPRKTDLQLFIDFLHEQGTIVNARPNEVEAEGYDVIRFFRPKGGLTQEHFDALAAIDPYASGMLSRAVVERLVIDRGFGELEVHWAAEGLGYSIWDQVPDEKSFEVAAKEVELEIYRLRAERNNQPRPEAVVLGRPPRGGRLREVAPVGGVELERSRFLPGTDRGFSVDDEFQAHPMSCESLAKPRPEWEKHAGSLEALRVTRPEAVVLAGNKERDGHDESKINPYGDWSVIVVRQGTFALTPLARLVFPVIYRRHVQGLYVTNDYLRQETGLDVERFDRCLRSSDIWGKVVGPVPGRKGFWRILH